MNFKALTPIDLAALNFTLTNHPGSSSSGKILLIGLAGMLVGVFATYIIMQTRHDKILKTMLSNYEDAKSMGQTSAVSAYLDSLDQEDRLEEVS